MLLLGIKNVLPTVLSEPFTLSFLLWEILVALIYFPHSAADVVEKIEWLKSHDKEAQQIATNARNFGLSYLRLEDQYCYVATLLDTLGGLSDVVYVVSV